MESKIIMPKTICEDEVIGYLAERYSSTPENVIKRYMQQEGIITSQIDNTYKYNLEENEIAILRDMGLRPSQLEFTEKI